MSYQKISIHCSVGGNKQGIGDYFRALDAAGRPAIICSYYDYGVVKELLDLRQASGVPHIGVFKVNANEFANPDYNKPAAVAGREYWEFYRARFPPELVNTPHLKKWTWVIWGNEGRRETIWENGQNGGDWWGEVAVTFANLALAEGFRTLAWGWSAGTPDKDIWQTEGMKSYLRLCHEHPNMVGIAVHEGADPRNAPPPFYGPLINNIGDITARYIHAFDVCDQLNLRRPRIFISECAWFYRSAPGVDQAMAHVHEAAEFYAQHPEVLGIGLWTTMGPGGVGEFGDVADKVQALIKPLTDYALSGRWDGAPIWPDGAPHYQGELEPLEDDGAEAAGFAVDVDLGAVAPGSALSATWTFRNTGSTTWSPAYRFAFSQEAHPQTANFPRSPMGARTAYTLAELGVNAPVLPGQTVDLTVPLIAPAQLGTQATNWQLEDPAGHPFGPIRWLRAVVSGSLNYAVDGFNNNVGNFSNVQPGRTFAVSWTLRNTGSAAWSGAFAFAYVDRSVDATQNMVRRQLADSDTFTLHALTGRDSVAPGESVTLTVPMTAPQANAWYASHWELRSADGTPFGGTRWATIQVVGAPIVDPDPTPVRPFQPGMNINPDAHAWDDARLTGLSWVRLVFKAAAKMRSVEDAFAQYDPIVNTLADRGIRTLFILNQETVWGNAPWHNGAWGNYAPQLADAAQRIAAHYGTRAAYQIWNEGDSVENPSAIHVPADAFAAVLQQSAQAIRAAAPEAKVIFGGLNTGPESAVAYINAVRQQLGGSLPVDALAYHPYGRYVDIDPFYNEQFGKLADALTVFKQAFPTLPLWITELGVADNNPIGPEHYAKIAGYMNSVVEELVENHADHVPVLIWFAWTDAMRNAGILTAEQPPQEKAHVFDAYVAFRERSAPPEILMDATRALSAASAFLSFDTDLADHTAVPAGSTFTNTWRFKNVGATIWGPGHRLVYTPTGLNSRPMRDQQAFDLADVALPQVARPGDEVTISLTLTAPEPFGRVYHSRWELRDPANTPFGHLYSEITVIPGETAGSGARRPDMAYIADRTLPDGAKLPEGTDFTKQWEVENNGTRHWGDGFRLVFVEGDLTMARGAVSHVVPPAAPGERVILSIPMTVPPAVNRSPKSYTSVWRLQDDHGNLFGPPIWAKLTAQPSLISSGIGLYNDPSAWYSQLDPRWRLDKLGHGNQDIGSWGCLVTCYAMMVTAFGLRLTPPEFNARARQLAPDQGFQGSNIQFIAPAHILPGVVQGINLRSWAGSDIPFSQWTGEDPLERIDRALAAGHAVVAQVDRLPADAHFNSTIEQHWVLIVARTERGDDYLILDPSIPADLLSEQPLSLMGKYGNRVPSWTDDVNLRNAIKSTLVYRFSPSAMPVGG